MKRSTVLEVIKSIMEKYGENADYSLDEAANALLHELEGMGLETECCGGGCDE